MDCSSPVLHHLPELAQTHVLRVSDAIQPSHHLVLIATPHTHYPHGPGNPFPHSPQSSNTAPFLPCHSPAMGRASHKEGAPPSRAGRAVPCAPRQVGKLFVSHAVGTQTAPSRLVYSTASPRPGGGSQVACAPRVS